MGWIPGWPQDPVTPKGPLVPQAVVLHRTYGGWGGDYSVGRNEGLFQFLIGQNDGQYVQFMSTESIAYHCNGANFRAFGIELTGTNEDVLTDWQVTKLGEVLRYARDTHGIPLTYTEPDTVPPASVSVNRTQFVGVISHVSVATDDGSSQHTDLVTPADYARAVGTLPSPSPQPVQEDDMVLYTTTDNGKTVYYRDASGILVALRPEEAAPYFKGLTEGWVHLVPLGGFLSALAYNHNTVEALKKAGV